MAALLRVSDLQTHYFSFGGTRVVKAVDRVSFTLDEGETIGLVGDITHTPAYGNLIALGVLTALQAHQAPNEQIAEAISYREQIARSGRFLTYCGGAPIIGQRMRPDPRQRVALELVRESDAGVVIRGKLGMHTSPAYAEDVYIGALTGIEIGGHRAGLILPVNAPGVTTLCRKIAACDRNPFVAPLSSRFDEARRPDVA